MQRIVTLLFCLIFSPCVLATEYTYSRINVPGSAETQVRGINARGEIVGTYLDKDGTPRSFLLRNGLFSEIKVPGALETEARQINARGDVVGAYLGRDDRLHGFLLSNGKFTRIDHSRALNTAGFGINNAGDVVGIWRDEEGNGGSYILKDGKILQPSVEGNLFDIQDNGRVLVGTQVFDSGGAAGFVSRKKGEFELIEYPDQVFPCTVIRGINQRGQMVGTIADEGCGPPFGDSHGFLYQDGEFTRIGFPGASGTDAWAINDDGVIVGRFVARNGAIRGFRARPKN